MLNSKDVITTKDLVVSALFHVPNLDIKDYLKIKPKVIEAFDIIIKEMQRGKI